MSTRAQTSLARVTEQLEKISNSFGELTDLDYSGMQRQAQSAAATIASTAARAHHKVGVRIVQQGQGIRVTLTGPAASRYRAAMARELNARMPGVAAEISTQITRRVS